MSKKLGARPWRTRVEGSRAVGKRQLKSIAGSDVLWRLWVSEFQAQRNPPPEVLIYAENTVAERLDCGICIAKQARVSEVEEQRPTECVVHVMCSATADDHEFGQAEDACGQAWRQTIMARSNLYDSTAHPAWPICRPVFLSLLRTSTTARALGSFLNARGRGRQLASPHAHLARCTERIGSARRTPPSVWPCDRRPYRTATATSDA